jgi:filamentous hemagglutinin family protein
MASKKYRLNKLILSFIAVNILSQQSVFAQNRIVPDSTLGIESPIVTGTGNIIQINGGANRGITNLGSYLDFSINAGQSVSINTSTGIRNVVVRITGSNISEILGNLSVPGSNKNLFLINPNGTIFGPNAKVLTNGGFTASTAKSIDFDDKYSFLANAPNAAPVFALGNPTSLQFSGFTGAITVLGSGHSITQPNNVFSPNIGAGQSLSGLRSSLGNTLTFAAAQIDIKGGLITASNINLNSIISGKLLLSGAFTDTTNISTFGNINLSDKALIDSSGFGGGNISLFGNDISFSDGSLAINSNFGSLPAGKIILNATGTLNLNGIGALSQTPPGFRVVSRGIISQTFNGQGADIQISAKNLIADNSVGIVASTFGTATGGNLKINADDFKILGRSPFGPISVGSLILSTTAGTGKAGSIIASGKNLFIDKGGFLISATFDSGTGGDVFANFDKITLNGGTPIFDQNTFIPSAIASTSAAGGAGGSLNIRTGNLEIDNGARVDASALSNGTAGSIDIVANNIDINGTAPGIFASQNPSFIISGASQVGPFLTSVFNLSTLTAQSGTVKISSNQITLNNGGQIAVRNDGTGAGGLVNIDSQKLFLNNNSSINSSTNAGGGGSIYINTSLLFTRNSQIIASAGNNGAGGNIFINSDVLAGDYLSAIRANAQQGRGGLVSINTQALIFNNLNNITATSAGGPSLNGTVRINSSTVTFQPQPQLESSLLISNPITCNNDSSSRLRLIKASDLNLSDGQLETFTDENNIPAFIDGNGKILPLIEIQGGIPLDRGRVQTVSIIDRPNSQQYLSSGCQKLSLHE